MNAGFVLGVDTEVVVDAALPGAVRVGEVDLDAGLLGQLPMAGHLFSLVVGHGEPVLRVDPCQDAGEAMQRGLCARVLIFGVGLVIVGSVVLAALALKSQ